MSAVQADDSAARRLGLLRSRRGLAAAATAAVAAAVGLAAYAQFSPSTGANPPAGPVGATLSAAPTSVGPLSPQLNPADTTPVTVTVDNTGSASIAIGQISGVVRSSAGCPGSWFTVAPIAAPGQVAPGTHSFGSSVILNDNDRDQSACTSQPRTIDWTIAAG